MSALKPCLDTRRFLQDGTAPVKIKLSHNGKTAYIGTGIYVQPEQWNGFEVVKHPKRAYLNERIDGIWSDLNSRLAKLSHKHRLASMPLDSVKRLLLSDEASDTLFADRFISYMNTRRASRTRAIYKATLDRMKEYDNLLMSRSFEEIDRHWIKNFDVFLSRNSPSANARNIHLRNIRAVFNDAIDDELISCYPFRRIKIKPEPTMKRSLSVEELRELFSQTPPPPYGRYLDYFKLMFLLVGINTVDLCALDKVRNGRIEYKRAKTGRLYSVKVEPEAMELICRHRGRKKLLDIMDSCSNYLNFASRYNMGLHKIMPGLSSYWARHSWATIAAELDIPKETIAAGLGHGGNTVTDIYIRFDRKKVDEANRKVIDYVLYDRK